jgi:hypothetical protein
MPLNVKSNDRSTETDRGIGPPATPASPAHSAYENDRQSQIPSLLSAVGLAAYEVSQGELHLIPFDPIEDGEAEAIEIEKEFRARLTGLRRLPRNARAAALRGARERRDTALKALREKRARERFANFAAWRLKCLAARPPKPN